MLRILRILIGLFSLILLLAVLAAVFVFYTFRRSFPQTGGQIRLSGLDAPVDIYRDPYGVPHIYAQTPHDLFFAQGYVHAQDRFFQMDFWRHIGAGRLSEMFPGESQLQTDRFLRTLGWARVARQELESMDAGTRSILEAYAEGVNAYLVDHDGSALSLEYAILGLNNGDYEVEPWQPLHSITWAKAMAWDLRSNLGDEIERALLLSRLTPEQVEDLYPPYPADHPTIVPRAAATGQIEDPKSAIQNYQGLLPAVESVSQKLAALDALLGPAGEGIGSNSWVISGKLTATGKPLLANDPHLAAQMPSIWYEIGLHCAPQGPECSYDVTGFSFPGDPWVIIGHNQRIAWGVTNLSADVMDLYIEKINPENPNQYEVNGEWVDMQSVKETIRVAGGEPVEITVRYTRHGPVISDIPEAYPPIEAFDQKSGIELPDHYALALHWTALEPTFLYRAILGFNLAQDWDEFREAARHFSVPAQNLVYADVDGNIGYQTPGNIPVRAGGDGRYPVPGWTDAYEWVEYIPFEDLPSVLNPPEGYIATANNTVAGPDFPYLLSTSWDYGYRARRIVEMIRKAPGPIDIAFIQQMQGDNRNLIAEILVPVLLEVPLEDPQLQKYAVLLEGWDYQNNLESAPAALFAAFWKHLLRDTFQDELPEDVWIDGGSRSAAIVSRLVELPDSPWWDNGHTAGKESRQAIFRQAFGEAVAELEDSLGTDPSRWAWGDLHTVTFRNQSLGRSGIPVIEATFNRGPYSTSGGSSIVNATSWDASDGEHPYAVRSLPSMRMIVDLGDLGNSLSIHTTGQSGHAYHPHYIDMADLWRQIQFHPMHWDRSQIEAESKEYLRLAP